LEKKNKVTAKRAEEHTSNKVLSMFMAGALLLWAFSYLYKLFDYPTTFDKGIFVSKIVMIIALVGIIGGAVWYFISRARGIEFKERIITPLTVVGFFAVVGISAYLLYNNYVLGMKLIYALIPAAVIFYLIYNVYQRAFLWLGVTHAFIALVIYFMSKTIFEMSNFIMGGVCIVICAIAVLIGISAVKEKGSIKIGNKKIVVFEHNAVPTKKSILLIYGFTVALVIACMFAPSFVIMYAFYAVSAFLVCCAIYFTIRLM